MFSYDFKDTLRKLLVNFFYKFLSLQTLNLLTLGSGIPSPFPPRGGGGGGGADGVGGLDHDCLLSNITQMLLRNGGFCKGCIVKGLIYRLQECLSNHLNWVPHPIPLIECDTLACGGGGGGTQFRRLTETLVLHKVITLRAASQNNVLTAQQVCIRIAFFTLLYDKR
jgi:hypothetical protein